MHVRTAIEIWLTRLQFDGRGVAAARGDSWQRFAQAHRFEDRGYRVTASSFLAPVS